MVQSVESPTKPTQVYGHFQSEFLALSIYNPIIVVKLWFCILLLGSDGKLNPCILCGFVWCTFRSAMTIAPFDP